MHAPCRTMRSRQNDACVQVVQPAGHPTIYVGLLLPCWIQLRKVCQHNPMTHVPTLLSMGSQVIPKTSSFTGPLIDCYPYQPSSPSITLLIVVRLFHNFTSNAKIENDAKSPSDWNAELATFLKFCSIFPASFNTIAIYTLESQWQNLLFIFLGFFFSSV